MTNTFNVNNLLCPTRPYPYQLIKAYENSALTLHASQVTSELLDSAYDQDKAIATKEKIKNFITSILWSFHTSLNHRAYSQLHPQSFLESSLNTFSEEFSFINSLVPSCDLENTTFEHDHFYTDENHSNVKSSKIADINHSLLKLKLISFVFFKRIRHFTICYETTGVNKVISQGNFLPKAASTFIKSLDTYIPDFNLETGTLSLNGDTYTIRLFDTAHQVALSREFSLIFRPCPHVISATSPICLPNRSNLSYEYFLAYPMFQGQTLQTFINEPYKDRSTLITRLTFMMTLHEVLTTAHLHLAELNIRFTDLHPDYIAIEEEETFKIKILPESFSKPYPYTTNLPDHVLQSRAPEQDSTSSAHLSLAQIRQQWLQQNSWQLGHLFFKILTGTSLHEAIQREMSSLTEADLHAFLDQYFSQLFISNPSLKDFDISFRFLGSSHKPSESIISFFKHLFQFNPEKRYLLGSDDIKNSLCSFQTTVEFQTSSNKRAAHISPSPKIEAKKAKRKLRFDEE